MARLESARVKRVSRKRKKGDRELDTLSVEERGEESKKNRWNRSLTPLDGKSKRVQTTLNCGNAMPCRLDHAASTLRRPRLAEYIQHACLPAYNARYQTPPPRHACPSARCLRVK